MDPDSRALKNALKLSKLKPERPIGMVDELADGSNVPFLCRMAYFVGTVIESGKIVTEGIPGMEKAGEIGAAMHYYEKLGRFSTRNRFQEKKIAKEIAKTEPQHDPMGELRTVGATI